MMQNQWNLSYPALLTLCSDEILDCKLQIADLNSQVNNIVTPSTNWNIITVKEE